MSQNLFNQSPLSTYFFYRRIPSAPEFDPFDSAKKEKKNRHGVSGWVGIASGILAQAGITYSYSVLLCDVAVIASKSTLRH